MILYSFIASVAFSFLVLVLTTLLNPHISGNFGILFTLLVIFYILYGFLSFVTNNLANLIIKKLFPSKKESTIFLTSFLSPVIIIMLIMCYGFWYNANYYHSAISDSSYKLLSTSGYFCIIGAAVLFLLILLNSFRNFNFKKVCAIVVIFTLIGIFNTMLLVEEYKPFPFDKETINKRDTGLNISIIGLDALSWNMIDPMMKMGYMPSLNRLRKHSSWGDLRTLTPTKSNVVWTSIATGKKPVKHGIKSFFKYNFVFSKTPLMILPKNLFMMLFLNFEILTLETVKADERHAAPIWNISGLEKDEGTAVVNWWSSVPPDTTNGLDFSNFIYYQKAGYNDKFDYDVTYPSSLEAYTDTFAVKDDSYVKNFIAGKNPKDADSFDYKYVRDRIYKKDEFYFRAGTYFFRKYNPGYFYFYLNGTDLIAHYFLNYFDAENSKDLTNDDKSSLETMERYYDYVDSRICEFLKVQDDNRIFVFVSDHGMVKTPSLIRQYRNRIVKNPYLYGYHDDAINGFFMIAGPKIKPDNHIDAPSVYDITPTVLYLMGYPAAKDMDGEIVKNAIDENFLSKFEVETINTYDHLNRVRPIERK